MPQYLPVGLPYFSLLAIVLLVLVIIIELRAFRYAYQRIGLSSRAALLLLLASLIGSYFNIPIAELPARHVLARGEVQFFGVILRGASRRPMAGHADCRECRRRGDSDPGVGLAARNA